VSAATTGKDESKTARLASITARLVLIVNHERYSIGYIYRVIPERIDVKPEFMPRLGFAYLSRLKLDFVRLGRNEFLVENCNQELNGFRHDLIGHSCGA